MFAMYIGLGTMLREKTAHFSNFCFTDRMNARLISWDRIFPTKMLIFTFLSSAHPFFSLLSPLGEDEICSCFWGCQH